MPIRRRWIIHQGQYGVYTAWNARERRCGQSQMRKSATPKEETWPRYQIREPAGKDACHPPTDGYAREFLLTRGGRWSIHRYSFRAHHNVVGHLHDLLSCSRAHCCHTCSSYSSPSSVCQLVISSSHWKKNWFICDYRSRTVAARLCVASYA